MIKLKSLLFENTPEISFREETRGSHHGQSDLTLYAEDSMGNYLGHIDYSVYRETPAVQMIKVPTHNQRMGIATSLIKHLQSLFPDTEIDMGSSTEEGGHFLKSLKTTYTKNIEHEKLTKRLEFLKTSEQKLSRWADNQPGPINPKISDVFNKISDEIWEIEQKLRYMTPGKTLVSMTEMTEANNDSITIDDLMNHLEKIQDKWSYPEKSLLKTIESFYYSDDTEQQGYAKDYISLLNNVLKKVESIGKNLGVEHVDIKNAKNRLIQYEDFHNKIEDYFPFPLYISQQYNDGEQHWGEIGVMVDINGKVLEIFEGNDEAMPDTITYVNKIINPSGKPVRIYASHNSDLVRQIEISGYLPKNLYVSPNKEHAAGHMDLKGERSMFSGVININDISQESDIDWKTMDKTKIERFRWI